MKNQNEQRDQICKEKKLRDQIIFWITWSPSLLGDQAIETKKICFAYK